MCRTLWYCGQGPEAVGSTNKAFVLPQNINIFSVIEVYWESTHNSGGVANATGVLGVPVSEIDGAHAMNHRIDRSAGGGVAITPSYSGKTLNLKNTVGVQFTAKAILGIKNPSGTTAAPDPVTTDPVDPVDPGTPTAVSANAGPNVSVESGDSVSIGGTDSVTSGVGATTYSWARQSGAGGSLNSARTAQPTFTAPTVTSNRTIVFIKTTTNNGVSDSDDVTITVTPAATQAPGAPSTPRATEREETSLTLATTPGAGGAATGYRWRISTNSAVTNADAIHTSSGPSITITGLNSNDNYWVDVRAENSTGNSAYSGNLATSTTAGTTTTPSESFSVTWVSTITNTANIQATLGTDSPTIAAANLEGSASGSVSQVAIRSNSGNAVDGQLSVAFLGRSLISTIESTLKLSITYSGTTLTSTIGSDRSPPYVWRPANGSAWGDMARSMLANGGTATITVSA